QTIDGDPDQIRQTLAIFVTSRQLHLFGGGSAKGSATTPARTKHESPVDEILQYSAHGQMVVVLETQEDVRLQHRPALLDVFEHRFPQRATTVGAALLQPPNTIVVRAQRYSKHV